VTVFEAICRRYSCRDYQKKEIEEEKLSQILEAARQAPSAKNLQDWRFVVVLENELKSKVAECTNRARAFEKAGAIIVACSNSGYVMRCGQAVGPIDVAIALEHISLTATESGLATCWIGSFDAEKVRAIVGVPEDITIIELMTIGYPAEEGRKTDREPIEKIVRYNKWDF
jgi:nitroreductase